MSTLRIYLIVGLLILIALCLILILIVLYRIHFVLEQKALSCDEVKLNENVPAKFIMDEVYTNTIGMKLKRISAGNFMMGSPDSEINRHDSEGPIHRVHITKPFYIGMYEVTQAQWKAVMGTEPWKGETYTYLWSEKKLTMKEGPNYPATYVSWEDAVEFCKKLSAREGLTYRLPTEAQWEYACRAGTNTAYCFGNDSSKLDEYAWFRTDPQGPTEDFANEVGQKRPNAWGLYDMHGNVYEMCRDWYAEDYYENSPIYDPDGPAVGTERVYRGGYWFNDVYYCRSAFRNRCRPSSRMYAIGFRVVIVASE